MQKKRTPLRNTATNTKRTLSLAANVISVASKTNKVLIELEHSLSLGGRF